MAVAERGGRFLSLPPGAEAEAAAAAALASEGGEKEEARETDVRVRAARVRRPPACLPACVRAQLLREAARAGRERERERGVAPAAGWAWPEREL